MLKDFSNKNLQGASFKKEDLSYARFHGADLRGADFTGSDLSGADLTEVKTGIKPVTTIWIFLVALVISALSGYVAMLAGQTLQAMFRSEDTNVKFAGIACSVIIVLFIIFSTWKGVDHAIRHLVLPVMVSAALIGVISYISGVGTGMGVVYLVLAILLVVVMFLVGTVARAAAGAMSGLLFFVVAISGATFGKSVGGGLGTVIMAVACMIISKRALQGAHGFRRLRRVATFITRRFGTSFRDSKLRDANFSRSHIRNSDFSHADTSYVHWGNVKKVNCVSE